MEANQFPRGMFEVIGAVVVVMAALLVGWMV